MVKFPFTNYEGQKYQLSFRKPLKKHEALGICNPPEPKKTSRLYVDPSLEGWQLREITLHEITHAFFWDVTEEKVDMFAQTVIKALMSKESNINPSWKGK